MLTSTSFWIVSSCSCRLDNFAVKNDAPSLLSTVKRAFTRRSKAVDSARAVSSFPFSLISASSRTESDSLNVTSEVVASASRFGEEVLDV